MRSFILGCFIAVLCNNAIAQSPSFPAPEQVEIGRHTFFDFGPPFDFYELFIIRSAGNGSSIERITITPAGSKCFAPGKVETQVATISSRTMRWGGALLLVFIVVHILHFTTGDIRPAGVFSREDVYANVVTSFRIWWVTLFYVVAMLALGLHLFHGAWSSVRSIGVSPPSPHPLHRRVSLLIAVFVWAAFTAIPVAVLSGIVR